MKTKHPILVLACQFKLFHRLILVQIRLIIITNCKTDLKLNLDVLRYSLIIIQKNKKKKKEWNGIIEYGSVGEGISL